MVQKIRVLINGAKGKMGLEAIRAVGGTDDMEIVAQTDLGDNLLETIKSSKTDVVVDLTAPSCAYANATAIFNSGAGGVIGTTGFNAEQINELTVKCQNRKPAILIAPNFSVGAILMMHCSQIIGKYMPDVEIIELHHEKKLDAPSGTAVKTAELIATNRGKGTVPRGTDESAARGERFSDIPIHSVRLPGLLAHQTVLFGGEGQTLTLRHDSMHRGCFMPGILLGVREVVKREGLIYGLEHLLFSE
jgi:4-hydroxy-tetrahydrodipicolinate reductase